MDLSITGEIGYIFTVKSGRIVLINLNFNCLKLSLCNIYAPNNPTEQIQFIQDLSGDLMDESELTTIIVGGDWNCTFSRKDKKGGVRGKPTNFRNALTASMDVFDLLDIQRYKYPNFKKYPYSSKALDVKSRIGFLLIAKNLDAKNQDASGTGQYNMR